MDDAFHDSLRKFRHDYRSDEQTDDLYRRGGGERHRGHDGDIFRRVYFGDAAEYKIGGRGEG